jgi:ABC-2 type transport system permease protein
MTTTATNPLTKPLTNPATNHQPPTPRTPRTYGALNWIGLVTLYQREVRRFWKVAVQTIFGPVVATWLLMVVFVMAFGADTRKVGEVSFPDFLAPGLIMLTIIQNAFANSSSSLLVGKIMGNTGDFLMAPLSPAEQTAAFVAGATTRGVLVAIATALSVVMFADIVPVHWGATTYFAIVASVIFSAAGVLGGVWADKFDNLAFVTSFFIAPLTFLSGTFYSAKALPEPFHTIILWNPVFHLIDGFRYGFTGVADASVTVSVVSSGLIALGLVAACLHVFRTGWRLKS